MFRVFSLRCSRGLGRGTLGGVAVGGLTGECVVEVVLCESVCVLHGAIVADRIDGSSVKWGSDRKQRTDAVTVGEKKTRGVCFGMVLVAV